VRYHADVKFYTFEIVIEKEEEDEGYLAYSPTLRAASATARPSGRPGGTSRGGPAARRVPAHSRQPIPQNEKLVHVEELTVGIP